VKKTIIGGKTRMNTEEMIARIIDKVVKEMNEYKEQMLQKSPEHIFHSAYQILTYENFLDFTLIYLGNIIVADEKQSEFLSYLDKTEHVLDKMYEIELEYDYPMYTDLEEYETNMPENFINSMKQLKEVD
jgi:hypothetical protein